jgi:hypothetical protein
MDGVRWTDRVAMNGEWADWARCDPDTAAAYVLLWAQEAAGRRIRSQRLRGSDADDAAARAWTRLSADDWAIPCRHPERPFRGTLVRVVDYVLREQARGGSRETPVGDGIDEVTVVRDLPGGAMLGGEALPRHMTRKQSNVLKRVLGGEATPHIAESLGIDRRSVAGRLARIAAVVRDPARWERSHQRVTIPAIPPCVRGRMTPAEHALVRAFRRGHTTRRSLAKVRGVFESTIKKQLNKIRKLLSGLDLLR